VSLGGQNMTDNILDKIREEHDEFKQMLSQLASGDAEQETFSEFKTELKAHIQAEEQTLYKSMMEDNKGRMLALVGTEEHRMGTEVLNKLDQSSMGNEEWMVQLNVLKHLLEKHIEEEETKVLPLAEELLDEQKMGELSEQFESIEESLEQKQVQ
jgi:hemerythrin-like domain-containing protein